MAGVSKETKSDEKPLCKYGAKCYRKNPQHIQKFTHPGWKSDVTPTTASTSRNVKTGSRKTDTNIADYFGKRKEKPDLSESEPEAQQEVQASKKLKTEASASSLSSADDKLSADDNETDATVGDSKDTGAPAESSDEGEGPEVNTAAPNVIKSKFLVDMPDDFYNFWEFCQSLNPDNPRGALKESLNLRLVGPFDILSANYKHVKSNKEGRQPNFLLHFRFFYDPPEFQTVLVSNEKSQYHLGYYRDDPKEDPVFVASNSPGNASPEKIYPSGDNLFAAVYIYAKKLLKSTAGKKQKSLEAVVESIEQAAKKHDLCLLEQSPKMKNRKKKVVCPTLHGAGIVVPVDSNDVGYRPVPITPGELRNLLKKIVDAKSEAERDKGFDELQELITLVQFANDECDYGEGLELGLDLFSFGSQVFHPQIESLLPMAYQLLNRPEFSQIITEHLKHRRGLTECVDELAV